MGDIRKTITENINHLCRTKKIKQNQIASYLGVSPSSVSNWIKGTNSIDIENLAKLCQLFEITPNQIYGIDPMQNDVTLSPAELEIIDNYRSCNEIGQSVIQSTAHSCANNPALQKRTTGKSAI